MTDEGMRLLAEWLEVYGGSTSGRNRKPCIPELEDKTRAYLSNPSAARALSDDKILSIAMKALIDKRNHVDGAILAINRALEAAERGPSGEETREACARVCEERLEPGTTGIIDEERDAEALACAKAIRSLALSTVGGKEKK